SGEFFSGPQPNNAVDPGSLPNRPFIGTELYWIDPEPEGEAERDWLKALHLDFLRVEVDVRDVRTEERLSNTHYPDLTSWSASDFENGHGWHFNDPTTAVTNILGNLSFVKFPLMLMMHYGGENYMGDVPSGADYAEYFLTTVYYFNVIRNMNIKYW